MSEKPSAFRFQEFKILKSSIDFVEISDDDFHIEINPKGAYSKSTRLYTLTLEVKMLNKMGIDTINILAESQFIFDTEFEGEIPAYFTINAPAITFPYIRAYVAALSALSGIGTMNLPILNLVDLAERLKGNFILTD
jgi:preprotein translocase subunit SecB